MRICFCWAVLSRYTWVGKNPVIFPMHSSLVKAMYPVYIKIFAYAYLLWKLEVEASTNSHWNNFEKMFQPLPALARPRAPGGIWLHGPWLRRNGQMNWCESKLPGENPPNDDTPTQIHGTNMSECYLASHLSRNETFSFREGFAHTITSWREELLMSLSLLRLRRFDMSEGETWREPGILFFEGGHLITLETCSSQWIQVTSDIMKGPKAGCGWDQPCKLTGHSPYIENGHHPFGRSQLNDGVMLLIGCPSENKIPKPIAYMQK